MSDASFSNPIMAAGIAGLQALYADRAQIGRASCRERV